MIFFVSFFFFQVRNNFYFRNVPTRKPEISNKKSKYEAIDLKDLRVVFESMTPPIANL